MSVNERCVACGAGPPSDPDHIKTRGSGGQDEEWNVWPLCRKHHRERHDKGLVHMANKYSKCKEWLLINQWYLDSFLGRWIRNKNRGNE